jgi:hypothetical protein
MEKRNFGDKFGSLAWLLSLKQFEKKAKVLISRCPQKKGMDCFSAGIELWNGTCVLYAKQQLA